MRKTILLVSNNKDKYNYNFSLYNEKPPNLGTVSVIIGSGIIIIIDKRKLFEIQIKKTCWLKYKGTEIKKPHVICRCIWTLSPSSCHWQMYMNTSLPPCPCLVKISHNFHCLKIIHICEHFFKAETTDFRYIWTINSNCTLIWSKVRTTSTRIT